MNDRLVNVKTFLSTRILTYIKKLAVLTDSNKLCSIKLAF